MYREDYICNPANCACDWNSLKSCTYMEYFVDSLLIAVKMRCQTQQLMPALHILIIFDTKLYHQLAFVNYQ